MKIAVGTRFPVLTFVGIVKFVSEAGAVIYFARVTSSGNRCGIGSLSIHYPCQGSWQVSMMLAMPPEFHDPHKAKKIRDEVFSALGIPETETWQMHLCHQPVAEISSEPVEGVIMLTSSG